MKNGKTVLISVINCRRNNKEIVRMLIGAGAGLGIQDENGMTALMYASQRGHKDIVRMLEGV